MNFKETDSWVWGLLDTQVSLTPPCWESINQNRNAGGGVRLLPPSLAISRLRDAPHSPEAGVQSGHLRGTPAGDTCLPLRLHRRWWFSAFPPPGLPGRRTRTRTHAPRDGLCRSPHHSTKQRDLFVSLLWSPSPTSSRPWFQNAGMDRYFRNSTQLPGSDSSKSSRLAIQVLFSAEPFALPTRPQITYLLAFECCFQIKDRNLSLRRHRSTLYFARLNGCRVHFEMCLVLRIWVRGNGWRNTFFYF